MAVQAHFPSAFDVIVQQQILNGGGAVVLSNPNSNLTSINATGTRKRNRDVASDAAITQQFQFPNIASKIPKRSTTGNKQAGMISSCLSARTTVLHPASQQHAPEIDARIRLHNDKLKSGLDELRKKHYAGLLQFLESQAAKRIAEKDAEIEILRRKQGELEWRMKQIAAESQVWFTVARNSEAHASNLMTSLDRVLQRQNAGGECNVTSAPADDAESCCYEGDGEDRSKRGFVGTCRACRGRGVSVLLLPCRHLCLCSECEPATGTCPICNAAKNVGLQVLLE